VRLAAWQGAAFVFSAVFGTRSGAVVWPLSPGGSCVFLPNKGPHHQEVSLTYFQTSDLGPKDLSYHLDLNSLPLSQGCGPRQLGLGLRRVLSDNSMQAFKFLLGEVWL
jgi:hypothetical protein